MRRATTDINARQTLHTILGPGAGGRPIWGMPAEYREWYHETLCEAANVRVEIDKMGKMSIISPEGLEATKEAMTADILEHVGRSVQQWLRSPGQLHLQGEHRLPSGATDLITEMGFHPRAVLTLALLTYQANVVQDDAMLTLRSNGTMVEYRRRKLTWKNGVIELPCKGMPDVVRTASRGQSVTDLVDDPNMKHQIVRSFGRVAPGKDRATIVTTSAGKREWLRR